MSEETAGPAPYQINYSHMDEFAEYARNSNIHSEEQIDEIDALICEFGWTVPIAKHNAYGMAAGHGRLRAARKIYARGGRIKMPNGYVLPVGFVPWIDVSTWSETQLRAYVIADNQIGRKSEFDTGLLSAEFELLKDDMPILETLFDDFKIIAGEKDEDEKKLELPEVTPVQDTFYVTLSGPLEAQAKAMQAIRQALGLWPGLKIEQGVMKHG